MPFNFPGLKPRKVTQFIIVHCSATGENQDIGAYEIDRWHRAKGWAGIGYHFVIRRDGQIEIGRPQEGIGAHCEGYNSTSIGVCLVGGVDANDINKAVNNFTPAQFATLKTLLEKLFKDYPKAALRGHRDIPGVRKACPSFDVRNWWGQVQGQANGVVHESTTT